MTDDRKCDRQPEKHGGIIHDTFSGITVSMKPPKDVLRTKRNKHWTILHDTVVIPPTYPG